MSEAAVYKSIRAVIDALIYDYYIDVDNFRIYFDVSGVTILYHPTANSTDLLIYTLQHFSLSEYNTPYHAEIITKLEDLLEETRITGNIANCAKALRNMTMQLSIKRQQTNYEKQLEKVRKQYGYFVTWIHDE